MYRVSTDEFIREFSKHGYTLKDSKIILEDFENTVCEIVSRGDSLRLTGFLEFKVKWDNERLVRNPRVADEMRRTPAKYYMSVKKGRRLLMALEDASAQRGESNAEVE